MIQKIHIAPFFPSKFTFVMFQSAQSVCLFHLLMRVSMTVVAAFAVIRMNNFVRKCFFVLSFFYSLCVTFQLKR